VIVECGHCGAPLDIEEGRAVVTCAYCTKKNRVAGLKTIAPTTPADFKAPEVWKPREESEPLAFHPKPQTGSKWPLALALVAAIGGGVAYCSLMRGSTVEEIASLPLDSSPDQIEKKLHVTWRTDDSVRVTFRSGAAGPYEHVNYRWSDKDFTFVEGISLFTAEGSKLGPNVIPTLDKSLHGGVDASGSWRWGPANVRVDPATGSLHLQVKGTVDDRPNPLRQRQLTALWKIVRDAAFGESGAPVAKAELVAVLGGGYPLAKLAAFDPQTKFGAAKTAFPMLFPGSLGFDNTAFEVAVDHPLLFSASLTWDNAADGRLHGVHFRVTPAFHERLASFVACLTKEVGPPEKNVSDFAKGTVSNTFRVRGSDEPRSVLDVHVGDQANLYFVQSNDAPAWARAFEAVDRCR
jgi:DNA-directed RNA polymerase subunit RPC12/RpoP